MVRRLLSGRRRRRQLGSGNACSSHPAATKGGKNAPCTACTSAEAPIVLQPSALEGPPVLSASLAPRTVGQWQTAGPLVGGDLVAGPSYEAPAGSAALHYHRRRHARASCRPAAFQRLPPNPEAPAFHCHTPPVNSNLPSGSGLHYTGARGAELPPARQPDGGSCRPALPGCVRGRW